MAAEKDRQEATGAEDQYLGVHISGCLLHPFAVVGQALEPFQECADT